MMVQPRWVIGLADGTGPGADPGADGASAEKMVQVQTWMEQVSALLAQVTC